MLQRVVLCLLGLRIAIIPLLPSTWARFTIVVRLYVIQEVLDKLLQCPQSANHLNHLYNSSRGEQDQPPWVQILRVLSGVRHQLELHPEGE